MTAEANVTFAKFERIYLKSRRHYFEKSNFHIFTTDCCAHTCRQWLPKSDNLKRCNFVQRKARKIDSQLTVYACFISAAGCSRRKGAVRFDSIGNLYAGRNTPSRLFVPTSRIRVSVRLSITVFSTRRNQCVADAHRFYGENA